MNRQFLFTIGVVLALAATLCGTQPVSALSAIQIDATALSVSQLTLHGVAIFPTHTVQSFDLLPGNYQLQYGTVVGFGIANFAVTASGTVDYDPSLDSILSGRGTNSLTILGATVQVDATALSVANLTLHGVGSFPTQATFSATLLPGFHSFAYATVVASAAANFTVTASGTVDYDPSLDSILSGRGTNSLTILGATVQIDATALSVASLLLAGISDFPTQTIFSATLLPGPHMLQYGTVVGFGIANFAVTASGTVDYDPSLDLILSGRNTSTLTLVGVPIRINAATLNGSSFDILGVGNLAVCPEPIVTLLPAIYRFVTTDVQFNFVVTNGAVVNYDAALDSFVSGRGTNTLTIHGSGVDCNIAPVAEAGGPYSVNEGASVTVTASGSDPENGLLTYAWDLDNNGSFEIAGQSATFSAASLDGPSSVTIQVQVTDDGGLTATDQATVNVLNVAPTATFISTPSTIVVGQSVTLSFGNPFDPGAEDVASGFLYSYDCTNDGTFEATDSSFASLGCSYPTAGTFTVLGRIADDDADFTDYTVEIIVMTPREGIEGLIDQVQGLMAQGTLSPGQGNALLSKLDAAIKQMQKGKTNTAINELKAFINQVNNFMNATPPILTPADGQPLIDAANAIIAALSG